MKRNLILLTALITASAPLPAHHSFTADYGSNLITIEGTIVRFVWMNPHTRIDLDSKDAKGTVVHWSCEGAAPGGLVSGGWTKSSLKPGDRVTLEGYPGKDRPNICKTRAVTIAGGKRLPMN